MLKVGRLRCEYFKNPIGIGEKKPRFSWVLDSDGRGIMQSSYRIQVSKEDESFTNPLWDSGKVKSDSSVHVEYEGPEVLSRTRYFYRIRVTDNMNNESPWSKTNFFETGIFDTREWSAYFISPEEENRTEDYSIPLIRKEFCVNGEVLSARVYATSLGLYELYLNDKRIGDALLTPGWTSYNKRLQYQTYDVTTMLGNGSNAIGAVLGCGWYKGSFGPEGTRNTYGKRAALLLQLHIKYSDGSEQIVLSDESWKYSKGPILMSEIYHGETYDARLEIPGWNMPGFADAAWSPVYRLDMEKSNLVSQENEPVRVREVIKPLRIIKTPAGETVIDIGQNMVGWMRFTVKGTRGSKVVLKHGEVLDADGNFYDLNLRSARQTIEYILKGEGEECFEPHFTFQGFRYVKVEEYPGEPGLENFLGVVFHSDLEETGQFLCSNELVNQLQHNILWGMKGNFIDIPTDCPQRDERLGWTGDAQIFSRTASYLMNVASFFKKWLRDLSADQYADGGVPHVIPHILKPFEHSSSGWGDAAVICPWNTYLCYGDKRLLEEQFYSMKAWVEYIRSQAESGLIWNSGFHFGDWLGLDAQEDSYTGSTSKDLISTAFYAYSTKLLAKAAAVLHRSNEERNYSELYNNIVSAFRKEFFTPAGRLAVPTQTAHVLTLIFNLVEDKDIKRTVDTLVKYLEENNWHLTTGFLGTPYLCRVLSDNNHTDTAYKLLLNTNYPSWLYQITRGATTIWEHWDGIKPDSSFWSTDMNSFNHYAYGSIGDWMYRVISGIDTSEEKPGYKHIIIKPQPGGGLTFASASFDTMYGKVKSSWKKEGKITRLEITIPHNTTATVILPGAKSNIPDIDSDCCMQVSEGVKLELGSGEYFFEYETE